MKLKMKKPIWNQRCKKVLFVLKKKMMKWLFNNWTPNSAQKKVEERESDGKQQLAYKMLRISTLSEEKKTVFRFLRQGWKQMKRKDEKKNKI